MMRLQKKNYLNACLFLFVVLSFFTACKGFVVDEISGSGDVSLSFRAIDEVVDSVLSVSISEGSDCVALRERKIGAGDDVVKVDFEGLSVGKDVTVTAMLIRDGAVLYKGSEDIVVEKGDNKVSLGLKLASVSLNLKTIELPFADLEDSVFKVSINGNSRPSVKVKPGSEFVSMDVGYVGIGNEIVIDASIEKDGKEWYKISKKHVVQESDSEIVLNMEKMVVDLSVAPGISMNINNYAGGKFKVYADDVLVAENIIRPDSPNISVSVPLGIRSVGENINIRASIDRELRLRDLDPDAGMVGADNVVEVQKLCDWSGVYTVKRGENVLLLDMKLNDGIVLFDSGRVRLYYGDFTPPIDDRIIQGAPYAGGGDDMGGGANFCFGPDKDLWCAGYEIVNLPHGKLKEKCYKVDKPNHSMTDIDYYDNGFLVVVFPYGPDSASLGNPSGGIIKKLTENKTSIDLKFDSKDLTITPPVLTDMGDGAYINKIAVSGNDIYAAFVSKYESDSHRSSTNHVKIFKGNIGSSGITFADNKVLFDSNTYIDNSGSTIFNGLTLFITDMLIQDGDLYVLLCDNGSFQESSSQYSNNSRGALVKIGANGSTQVVGFHNSKAIQDTYDGNVALYMIKNTDQSTVLNNFVGPRKFIAIKPKELVIADSGATYESQTVKHYKKRITTINLETMALSHFDIEGEHLFGGWINSSSGNYSSGLY